MSTTSSARTTGHEQAARTWRVHPFNTVTGLAFLAVVAGWVAADQDVLQGREVGQAVAIVLIVLGAAGVVGTLLVGRRPRRTLGGGPLPSPQPARPTDTTTDDEEDDHGTTTDPQR